MRLHTYLFLLTLAYTGVTPLVFASENDNAVPALTDGVADQVFTEQQRWDIKRQIMSRPGVFLDMANLTDNGYVWLNDVVWEGAALPENQKWHIAGFLFERAGYKPVWLQYAFTLEEGGGGLKGFKRWLGAASFR